MWKKSQSLLGAAPNRCHKRVVSLDGLLFSFQMMKLWKTCGGKAALCDNEVW